MPDLRQPRICMLLMILVALLGSARGADLVTFTQVQQQVGADIGYRIDGADQTAVAHLDPFTPQGHGDAALKAAVAQYGVSGTATLDSRFTQDRLTLKGSTIVTATWQGQPQGAAEENGAAASMFLSRLVAGKAGGSLNIDGSIGVGIVGDPRFCPGQTSVCVRLIAGSGILLWEESIDGLAAERLAAVSRSQMLVPHQEYRLAVYAKAGTPSGPRHEQQKSRAAWFDLNVAVLSPAPGADTQFASLMVATPELEILQVDGRRIGPPRISEDRRFREYSMPVGEHTVTAAFRRAGPTTGGRTREMRGLPVTCKCFFSNGRKYVATYQVSARAESEPRSGVNTIVTGLLQPHNAHWSMEVIDVADAKNRLPPVPSFSPLQNPLQLRSDRIDRHRMIHVEKRRPQNIGRDPRPVLERLFNEVRDGDNETSQVPDPDHNVG